LAGNMFAPEINTALVQQVKTLQRERAWWVFNYYPAKDLTNKRQALLFFWLVYELFFHFRVEF
jgi:hypothetical protein